MNWIHHLPIVLLIAIHQSHINAAPTAIVLGQNKIAIGSFNDNSQDTALCGTQVYEVRTSLCCGGKVYRDQSALFTCCGYIPCLTNVGLQVYHSLGGRLPDGGSITPADLAAQEMMMQQQQLEQHDPMMMVHQQPDPDNYYWQQPPQQPPQQMPVYDSGYYDPSMAMMAPPPPPPPYQQGDLQQQYMAPPQNQGMMMPPQDGPPAYYGGDPNTMMMMGPPPMGMDESSSLAMNEFGEVDPSAGAYGAPDENAMLPDYLRVPPEQVQYYGHQVPTNNVPRSSAYGRQANPLAALNSPNHRPVRTEDPSANKPTIFVIGGRGGGSILRTIPNVNIKGGDLTFTHRNPYKFFVNSKKK